MNKPSMITIRSSSPPIGLWPLLIDPLYIQGVTPGHEYLNISKIKIHSSLTFIWAYSVYSALVGIHFLNRSIRSRKTVYKVTF
jgi:hypothetical protein